LGAWTIYGLGSENQNLPAFVVLLDSMGGPLGGAQNWSGGFLPGVYQGTPFRNHGDPIVDLASPKYVEAQHQRAGWISSKRSMSTMRSRTPPNRSWLPHRLV
jgi:hypothetical protein